MVLMVLSTIRRFFTHSMTATGAGAAIEREVPVPELPDLSWVDEWVSNVRDHIYVREEDSVFIQRPNRAFHLNPQGVAMMKLLLSGQSIQQVLAPYRGSVQVWRDTEQFLLDVRKLLKEGLDDTYESSAVDKVPFDMEFSEYPVLSEVAVTYRCNARCQFCYAGCNCTTNPVGNDREMTLDEVKAVLQKIKQQAKVPSVSFTGGEATIRKDLPEMVRYARSLGMRVNLITNGILSTQELVDKLVDAGLNSVQVSIEGTTGRTHDLVTQILGAFEKSCAAVHRYRDAGVHVNTNTTINRLNLEEVRVFPEFVNRELSIKQFSMNLMIPTGTAALDESLAVRYDQLGPVLEEILACSRREGVEFKWYSPTPMCIFNPILHGLGNKGCSACDGLISVGADGEVLPCASYDEPVGSLLDNSFDTIWHGEKARSFRNKFLAHEICQSCENFHICNGACPLYWRKMGFDELLA
ncbi:MAG: radical SAM protein, partial [Planctomycetota bacterium]